MLGNPLAHNLGSHIMGKQYNKVIKRARRNAYNERRKAAIKVAKGTKGRK